MCRFYMACLLLKTLIIFITFHLYVYLGLYKSHYCLYFIIILYPQKMLVISVFVILYHADLKSTYLITRCRYFQFWGNFIDSNKLNYLCILFQMRL